MTRRPEPFKEDEMPSLFGKGSLKQNIKIAQTTQKVGGSVTKLFEVLKGK